MSFQKFFIVFLYSTSFVTLVVSMRAKDSLCEGVPDNEVVAFPHEYNCSLYYECFNGSKTLLECPYGLYFNNKTSSCDFPEASGCINGDPHCTGVDLDYLPHPDDCTKYIECYLGNSYDMNCPDGYWFDSKSKMCVTPENSDCATTVTPPWTTPHPLCWGVKPNQTVLKPYDGDCTKYWKCTGSELTEEQCPSGLYFDEIKQLCDFPENVYCEGSTIAPSSTLSPPTTPSDIDPRCSELETSYWPHPVDCNKYIECYRGLSYEMTCPGGLYFSDATKQCVNPQESECGKTTVSSTDRTTITWPTGWTADPDCPYPESEGKLLPFPGDCTKYYECAEGKKVEMPCPADLWFNPISLECDYPYQSNCKYRRLSVLDYFYYYLLRK